MLDPMTLDQLRVLVAVTETGSFSAAARRLGRVQSAISQSVQALETTLGVALFDRAGKTPVATDAGRVLVEDARHLLHGAEALRARAEMIALEVEPELTLAVDSIFPNAVLMASLKALSEVYPLLSVTLFTEGLGASEQRLRDGVARFAISSPLASRAQDLQREFLASVPMIPVVAASHPMAWEAEPIPLDVIERHTQLVLTDRSPLTAGLGGGILSRRIWRFADLGTRLDFLLAGFGWCSMPDHLVEDHIAAGRLKRLALEARQRWSMPLDIVYQRGRRPGRASRWLIEDMRKRAAGCNGRVAGAMPIAPAGDELVPPLVIA